MRQRDWLRQQLTSTHKHIQTKKEAGGDASRPAELSLLLLLLLLSRVPVEHELLNVSQLLVQVVESPLGLLEFHVAHVLLVLANYLTLDALQMHRKHWNISDTSHNVIEIQLHVVFFIENTDR